MTSKRRALERKAGAFALRRIQGWLLKLDPEEAEAKGAQIGRLIWRLAKTRRERCEANLSVGFPDMPERERAELARRVFEHYGRVAADFLVSGRRSDEDLERSVQVEGIEIVEAALALGKGAILVTGHFGNWERLSAWLTTHGYKLSVIARDTEDEGMNSLVNQLRSRTGARVIPRGNAARPMIERLRANELIGILPDQNSDEIFVPFFGKPAGTVLGPGVIAERTGAPVIPAWSVRTGPCQYKMWFEEPLVAQEGYGAKGEGMTRAINAALEDVIRRHPEQWLWFHDRWRSARRRGLL